MAGWRRAILPPERRRARGSRRVLVGAAATLADGGRRGLASLALVALVTLVMPTMYTATTRLFFGVQSGESATDLSQGSTFAEKQMSSYAQVAVSPLVLSSVIRKLDLEETPENSPSR